MVRGARPHRRRFAIATLLAVGLIAAAAAVWLFGRREEGVPPVTRVIPITSLDGFELMPTLSPDGTQVAFAWNGDRHLENSDMYAEIIGSATLLRLTTDPVMDFFPKGSPDGQQIAFVRQSTALAGRVYVTSPLGVPERKLSDFDVQFDRAAAFGQVSWSPDGRYIAAARPSVQKPGTALGSSGSRPEPCFGWPFAGPI